MNNGFESVEYDDDEIRDLLENDYSSLDEEEVCPRCLNGCKYCLMLED